MSIIKDSLSTMLVLTKMQVGIACLSIIINFLFLLGNLILEFPILRVNFKRMFYKKKNQKSIQKKLNLKIETKIKNKSQVKLIKLMVD